MSPRAASSASANQRNNSAPYSRRPTTQPKSSRQQFSACGACRMRRVRCDLKDLPYTASGVHPSCSNCKERGLKCVDEFAEVKAVKLLRRGRRLQQVEAIYGKTPHPNSSIEPRLPSAIPQLAPEFFSSTFWKWFTVQRPILDPVEFPARFIAHTKGVHSLGHEGGLIAMVLVVWAASFGLNECGLLEGDDDGDGDDQLLSSQEEPTLSLGMDTTRGDAPLGNERTRDQRKRRKEKADAMLREVLELVDFHGVLRRPSWDGVRVLLLILPLLEDAHPLEKLAMYEAALSQTQALCTLSGPSASTPPPLHGESDDAVVRAQIFWYAHIQEGITTAMRGGRLMLNGDDLDTFQSSLAPFGFNGSSINSIRPLSSHGLISAKSQRGSTAQSFLHISQLFSLPLQLSSTCRKVHVVLSGPKAIKRAEEHGLIDANGMREIWEDLDRCWKEFDAMRRTSSDTFDVEQYVSAWQIFIFECHNMIRESLKQNMCSTSNNAHSMYAASSRPPSHSSSSPYLSPQYLHVLATRKCLELLPLVLRIIKFHLSEERLKGLFHWDAGIVREGCFFAGYLAASVETETIDFPTGDRGDEGYSRGRGSWTIDEGVTLCLNALAEMSWAFSKSEEREEAIRMIWENRRGGRNTHRYSLNGPGRLVPFSTDGSSHDLPPMTRPLTMGAIQGSNSYPSLSGPDRPLLPPLHLLCSPRRAESAPNTGYTTNGSGTNGWPSYTPPRTGTSIATSAGTGVSRDSPEFASLAPPVMTFKTSPSEPHDYYEIHHDLDQFSFNVPVTGPGIADDTLHYHHRDPPSTAHSVQSTATSTYLDSSAFSVQGPTMVTPVNDGQNCSHFSDDPHGFYH